VEADGDTEAAEVSNIPPLCWLVSVWFGEATSWLLAVGEVWAVAGLTVFCRWVVGFG
jgi:hypothetical protein